MGKSRAANSVDTLVQRALKLVVKNPKAKLLGAGSTALFLEKEPNHREAIDRCLHGSPPLLKQTNQTVAITSAGFALIAKDYPGDQLAGVAEKLTANLSLAERADFLQTVIHTAPMTAAVLNPLLETAIRSEREEHEERIASAAKRRAEEVAAAAALQKTLALIEQRRANRLESLRREWEAEGANATELPELVQPPEQHPAYSRNQDAKEPSTAAEKDFRRDIAKQLGDMWRAAWKEQKHEAREYLESAMWNVAGLRMIGEPEQKLAFDGRYHECESPVFTDDTVRIIRPGWLMEEDERDFVVLKALVVPAGG